METVAESTEAPIAVGDVATNGRQKYRIIDCDVHHAAPNMAALQPYLAEPWRTKIVNPGSYIGGLGYLSPAGHRRKDAIPPGGGMVGSDPELLYRQLIVENKVDLAVLTGEMYGWNMQPNEDYANAVVSAFNDFSIEHWLEPYPEHFRGAITINSNDPQAAAAEIDRLGERADMAMVIMGATSTRPYGQKYYHPIYEAAARYNLPIGIHPANAGVGIAHAVTSMGYPRTFFEYHTGLSTIFQLQLISLVAEGVFEKYPSTQFIFIEGGVGWLPQLMWRMDKNYKTLRADAPWLTRLPSEYILDHCTLSTQPLEEPPNLAWLLQIFEMIQAEKTLLYASDYPHWDFDANHVLAKLPEHYKKAIFQDSAERVLRL